MTSIINKTKSKMKHRKNAARDGSDDTADGALSLFAAVEAMESQDQQAAKKRKRSTAAHVANSRAALSQQKIYNSLLETRILLQRALRPPTDNNNKNNDDDDHVVDSKEEQKSKKKVVQVCDRLLVQLLQTRQKLLSTSQIVDNDKIINTDYEKLVIGESLRPNDEMEDGGGSLLSRQLQVEFEECEKEWQTVFNRRHKDLRLHSGGIIRASAASQPQQKFKVLDSTFWQQVEATVHHEELRQKQQQQQLLSLQVQQSAGKDKNGKNDSSKARDDDNGTSSSDRDDDMTDQEEDDNDDNGNLMDREISETAERQEKHTCNFLLVNFDDTKVYQQLLKDFVTAHDPNTMNVQEQLAQERLKNGNNNLSSSKNKEAKKLVDRRASKGRKIRYHEIPKLVNFTFPVSRKVINTPNSSQLDEEAWFKSLFGGYAANATADKEVDDTNDSNKKRKRKKRTTADCK